jgi:hypothetical protein
MITLKSFIPKRTWLRFSLATFLLAVAVIAYGCKWTLDRVNHYAGQYNRLAIMSMNPEQFRWLHPPVASGSGTYGGHFVWSFAEPTGWEKAMADWMGIKYEVDVVALAIFQRTVDLARDMETALGMPHLKELA